MDVHGPKAQDGIYIRDFPRTLTGAAPIPAGGRADLMLRCPEANAEYPVTWGGNTIATATRSAWRVEVFPSDRPWYRWPIEIDGLPIKNGDFPWLC